MNMVTLIVIGTSAGGISALQTIFKSLPKDFSLPIVVTQHIAPKARIEPSLVFGQSLNVVFEEAQDKTEIKPGHVYFAPPNYHLLIEKDFTLSLSQDDPVHFARPSIDVCFTSAAHYLNTGVCGVLLTGANADGAIGLHAISKNGGFTIVQNPKEAEFATMPNSALERFQPSAVMTLHEITQQMISFANKGTI
jgi:two-component system, chemotaxis family, protein-glutamate methylesterase/glutaminase